MLWNVLIKLAIPDVSMQLPMLVFMLQSCNLVVQHVSLRTLAQFTHEICRIGAGGGHFHQQNFGQPSRNPCRIKVATFRSKLDPQPYIPTAFFCTHYTWLSLQAGAAPYGRCRESRLLNGSWSAKQHGQPHKSAAHRIEACRRSDATFSAMPHAAAVVAADRPL